MRCEWKEVELSEVADLTVGFVGTMASHYTENGILFLRSTNIEPFSIKMDDVRYISPEFNETIKKSQLNPDDVVIVRTGKPGACTVIPPKTEPWNCSDLVIIHPNKEKINPHFLASYINLASGVINAHLVGAVQQHFNVGAAKKMKIPLPPIHIQNRIASIIQGLNDKIELNNKINENLEQQAQALYKHYFPYSIDDELPDGWRIGTAGEIIEIHDSKRIPLSGAERSKMGKRIYPYYGAASLMDFVDDYIFDGKYLLLGEDGTVVDNAGYPILQYVWGQFWVNNHAHILTGKLGFNVESLYMLFKQTPVKSIVTGAVQPKISQANLRSIQVIVPPEKLLIEYNCRVEPLFSLLRTNKEENKSLTVLRDTLLPKLISGEIDVSDLF